MSVGLDGAETEAALRRPYLTPPSRELGVTSNITMSTIFNVYVTQFTGKNDKMRVSRDPNSACTAPKKHRHTLFHTGA